MKRFDANNPCSSSSSSSQPCLKRVKCSESDDESSSSSSSEPGSESDTGSTVPATVHGKSELLMSHLSSFPGDQGSVEDSCAATNGKCPNRIKTVLKSGCCSCKNQCHKAVSFGLVLEICTTFWNLSKAAQDCILWGMQNVHSARGGRSRSDSDGSNSDGAQKALNTWYFQGRVRVPTCIKTLYLLSPTLTLRYPV